MSQASANHRGGRFEVTVSFDWPTDRPTARDVRDFIKEWLESGGGCRHPDDPLFHSLGQVSVGGFRRVEARTNARTGGSGG